MIRRRLPSLTSLRTYEAVARHKSFTRAADELCVTQGAVSHQVKALEEELKAKLLIRSGLGIELTDAGKKMLDVAKQAFDHIAVVTADIRTESKESRAILRIQVSPQFSQFWLAPRVRQYSLEHPEIELRISYSSTDSPNEGTALIIAPGGNILTNGHSDRLFSSDLLPLCSPDFMRELRDCQNKRYLDGSILLCETDHDWWSEWNAAVGEEYAITGSRIWFDDPTMAVHVAVAGGGILMGSPALLKNHIQHGQLVAPLHPSLCVSRAYHLIYTETLFSNVHAQGFRSWLLSEIHDDERPRA